MAQAMIDAIRRNARLAPDSCRDISGTKSA